MRAYHIHKCPRSLSVWERLWQTGQGNFVKNIMDDAALAERVDFLQSPERGWSYQAINSLFRQEMSLLPLTPSQEDNLKLIGSKKPVFVFTGQQPGLLGGPLLSIYKALTAVSLCRRLGVKTGKVFIPVFWIAGDDSDLLECNRVELLEAPAVSGFFKLPFEGERELIPVGARNFGNNSIDVLESFKAYWGPETMDIAREALKPQNSFSSGFQYILQKFLGPLGVLFINGYSGKFRQLAASAMSSVVQRAPEFESLYEKATGEIGGLGLKPQASFPSGTVHAFSLNEDVRQSLTLKVRQRLTMGGGRIFNGSVPLDVSSYSASGAGLQLSHDAVSRPLLIDSVFPVAGHVLGPSEMGYFCQLRDVFPAFTGGRPLVFPRATVTVLPQAMGAAFESHKLMLPDLISLQPSQLKAAFTSEVWAGSKGAGSLNQTLFDDIFKQVQERHKGALPSDLRRQHLLNYLKSGLSKSWSRYLSKAALSLYQDNKEAYTPFFKHLRWVGEGRGQDRHLNILSLVNALGVGDFVSLLHSVDPLSLEHQVVTWK